MSSNSEAKTSRDLPQEIFTLYDAIVDRVAGLREETKTRVKELRKEQGELKERLRENLAKGETLRKTDFELLMRDIIQKRREREQEVNRILEEFKKEEEEMAQGLRRLLDKGREVRIKDFKKLLVRLRVRHEERGLEVDELKSAADQIKKEAVEMISQFKKEREEMAAAWRSLADKMQRKRADKAQI